MHFTSFFFPDMQFSAFFFVVFFLLYRRKNILKNTPYLEHFISFLFTQCMLHFKCHGPKKTHKKWGEKSLVAKLLYIGWQSFIQCLLETGLRFDFLYILSKNISALIIVKLMFDVHNPTFIIVKVLLHKQIILLAIFHTIAVSDRIVVPDKYLHTVIVSIITKNSMFFRYLTMSCIGYQSEHSRLHFSLILEQPVIIFMCA